jgi:hypothetical protein
VQLPAKLGQLAQVGALAVPAQLGTWKRTGAGGSSCAGDLQQICPVQSLLCWHDFGQLGEQKPPQQMLELAWPAQSDDVEQALGQIVEAGFRQRPFELRFGSRALADRQQISPDAVLHSVSEAHPVGQLLAAVQMDVL